MRVEGLTYRSRRLRGPSTLPSATTASWADRPRRSAAYVGRLDIGAYERP